MTKPCGLASAEHVLTARTKTNRSRRHVVGNQRGADNRASAHAEGVPALHERRYGVTREKFVDETGLRCDAKGWRSACRCGTTKSAQSSGEAELLKQKRVAKLDVRDLAN